VTTAEQERVARLLREQGPLAPPELRARIAADVARANQRRRILGGRWAGVLAPAAAMAAVLVALALVLPTLFGGEPTAVDAHGLSASGPAGPAPAPQTANPELLSAGLDGLAFPNWDPQFGWRAVGQRTDELEGRRTATVLYEHEGHEIGYTIVSGKPLDVPADAERRRVDGVEMRMLSDEHGHEIVVFERQGKTCVLSGHVERRSTLLELASWRGDGRVEF
jgi:hypothetical protein